MSADSWKEQPTRESLTGKVCYSPRGEKWAMMLLGFAGLGFVARNRHYRAPRAIFLMRRAISMISFERAPCR
jgi:hypothetical protein